MIVREHRRQAIHRTIGCLLGSAVALICVRLCVPKTLSELMT
jgi:hypothetical protein